MALDNPNGFVNIAANGTTVVGAASSHLYLFRVLINKAGAAANILQLYSGQSAATGVLIATIDTTAIRNYDFGGLRLPNGLTAVLGTGTAADITIVFE